MSLYENFVGLYFDGTSAKEHRVEGSFDQQLMRFGSESLAEEITWDVDDLRELRDQARGEGGIVLRHFEGVGRLVIDNRAAAGVIRRRASNLENTDTTRRDIRKVFYWSGGAIASVAIIILVIIPALANTLANFIPVEREVALGKTTLRQIERFVGGFREESLTCSSPEGNAALEKMTTRLTAEFETEYTLDIRVFDHPMINAFAVPGGHIVLFDGLLQKAENAEEVTGVLGHEMGHVVHRDPTRLTLRSAGSVGILGMVFGDFAGGALALILAEQLIAAQYAQDAESAADDFANEVLGKAGLPSAPFAGFFEKLRDEHGESEGLMSHIASHPALGERAENARAANTITGDNFTPVLSDSEWTALKTICNSRQTETVSD